MEKSHPGSWAPLVRLAHARGTHLPAGLGVGTSTSGGVKTVRNTLFSVPADVSIDTKHVYF